MAGDLLAQNKIRWFYVVSCLYVHRLLLLFFFAIVSHFIFPPFGHQCNDVSLKSLSFSSYFICSSWHISCIFCFLFWSHRFISTFTFLCHEQSILTMFVVKLISMDYLSHVSRIKHFVLLCLSLSVCLSPSVFFLHFVTVFSHIHLSKWIECFFVIHRWIINNMTHCICINYLPSNQNCWKQFIADARDSWLFFHSSAHNFNYMMNYTLHMKRNAFGNLSYRVYTNHFMLLFCFKFSRWIYK